MKKLLFFQESTENQHKNTSKSSNKCTLLLNAFIASFHYVLNQVDLAPMITLFNCLVQSFTFSLILRRRGTLQESFIGALIFFFWQNNDVLM